MEKINYKQLISKIDIEVELDRYGLTNGMNSGKNKMYACPYHSESNPSFGIALEGEKKGLFNCYGCGEKGNFFHLIAFLEDITYEQAVKKFYSSDIDVKSISKMQQYFSDYLQKGKKTKNKIKVISRSFLEKFKQPYGPFLKYLKGDKRKLTDDTIRKFNILCCDEGKWNSRVVVPVIDEKDRLIGCTARYIYDCDKSDKVRKVKESDVGKVLFGLKNIKKGSPLVLVEGEFDMIYLQQYGVPAVQSGKNPTPFQIAKVLDFTEHCIIALDGDVEYQYEKKLASVKTLREKLSGYIRVDVITLPEKKDPNELTPKEVEKLFHKYQGDLNEEKSKNHKDNGIQMRAKGNGKV